MQEATSNGEYEIEEYPDEVDRDEYIEAYGDNREVHR
jgi:hypothetical protein